MRFKWFLPLFAITLCLLAVRGPVRAAVGGNLVTDTIDRVQPKIVKIFGAGGFKGLEAYQSGFLISAEGHVLTAWSYVLDADVVTVVLNDGRQLTAELLGADPQLEIAVLKLEATDLPHFNLDEAVEAGPGARVLAFSNLFGVATGDEPASVQHGSITAKTQLAARRGAYETPYRGAAYVLDVMTNNPGAAGGALCNARGDLLGILGKELRNSQNNTWLNYAVPIDELRAAVSGIRAGNYVARPLNDDSRKSEDAISLELLGLVLVPDILDRTPPFIDDVRPGSPAHSAGLRPDDLVLFVAERLTSSCKALRRELEYIDRDSSVQMTVMRGQELLNVVLEAVSADAPSNK